ncbi:unnamed protein product [Protopolystoma xenopodis]|uniref:Uncharacterized protein n=1 Tax=Protopolystoma xenopodis TaxID=117903 RepID=A0A448WGV2_9PLAT|nr:unnamed protein product [Protopolystoma xenopodis]
MFCSPYYEPYDYDRYWCPQPPPYGQYGPEWKPYLASTHQSPDFWIPPGGTVPPVPNTSSAFAGFSNVPPTRPDVGPGFPRWGCGCGACWTNSAGNDPFTAQNGQAGNYANMKSAACACTGVGASRYPTFSKNERINAYQRGDGTAGCCSNHNFRAPRPWNFNQWW